MAAASTRMTIRPTMVTVLLIAVRDVILLLLFSIILTLQEGPWRIKAYWKSTEFERIYAHFARHM
jgi:hypothetical protein